MLCPLYKYNFESVSGSDTSRAQALAQALANGVASNGYLPSANFFCAFGV
jgi:hypothetical protein